MSACMHCGRPLTHDEIAIYRKMVSRAAKEYMCKTCLAQYFDVDESKIDQKIQQYKRQGCLLFVQ